MGTKCIRATSFSSGKPLVTAGLERQEPRQWSAETNLHASSPVPATAATPSSPRNVERVVSIPHSTARNS